MRVLWTEAAWEDYLHWQRADAKKAARINELVKDVRRNPFFGVGKPEPLRNRVTGWWSRRIAQENRLVYRVTGIGDGQVLEIAACRFHYGR